MCYKFKINLKQNNNFFGYFEFTKFYFETFHN